MHRAVPHLSEYEYIEYCHGAPGHQDQDDAVDPELVLTSFITPTKLRLHRGPLAVLVEDKEDMEDRDDTADDIEDINKDLHDRLVDKEVWEVDGCAEEEKAGEDDGGGPGERLPDAQAHLLENRLLRTTRA